MQSKRGLYLMLILGLGVMVAWQPIIDLIWPPKPPKPNQALVVAEEMGLAGAVAGLPLPRHETAALLIGGFVAGADPLEHLAKPERETAALIAGGLALGSGPGKTLAFAERPKPTEVAKVEPKAQPEIKPEELPKHPPELIALGHGDNPYYLQILLNSQGGSVQQVIVTEFPESDREGLEVKVNGKPKPLHLVPGVSRMRVESIRQQRNFPDFELKAGVVNDFATFKELAIAGSSYVMYHYDQARDDRPAEDLGNRKWTVVERSADPTADEQKVVFQTKLGEPHNLEITKTFTLKRRDYHVGMKVDIKRIDGKTGPNQFRYQIAGALGLPIEGEWYTSTYRQAIVGLSDERGNTKRDIEDAREIRNTEGSDKHPRDDKFAIRFAAVAVQYFAAAIAVDDEQEKRNFIEYVRSTPVGKTHNTKEFLDDLTVRAVTEALNPEREISHKYMLYHGPVKVRLLRQMPKSESVDDSLYDRYLDKLHLDIMTDAPMPNALGRFASAIFWTDLVLAFTNLVHSLLWAISQVIPSLALSILVLTFLVKGLLFPLSRRQARNTQVMQTKMAKLNPELKKLQEKFGGDFQRINQEKMKLYKEHGVNPFAAMGGCMLLLLQMPIMMGLYYALQESVFFRLDHFLWIPNLAAPDMLVFWGESIPFITAPSFLGSTFYLGPYLNILPIITVLLMIYQQKKMMPASDDPQVQAQQKMMKYMMIMFCLFFYKVAAGLCIYFIAGSLWGIAERNFIPKPKKPENGDDPSISSNQLSGKNGEPEEPKPRGWWGRRKALWREKWKDILEQAQKQSDHRQAQDPSPGNPDRTGGAGKKKKKKKR